MPSPVRTIFEGARLKGTSLDLAFSQVPAIQGFGHFVVSGVCEKRLGFNSGRTTLDVSLTDYFGKMRTIRINHTGRDKPWFGIRYGDKFERILAIWHDGVRTRFVKNAGQKDTDLVTVYLGDPSRIVHLGDLSSHRSHLRYHRKDRLYWIDDIWFGREIERDLLHNGTHYELGRLGAEVAYSVATQKLGLRNLVLVEPSKGGRDLYTRDGKAVMQARLVADPSRLSRRNIAFTLCRQFESLHAKLLQDFRYNPGARKGFGVVSYVIDNRLRASVLEISRS
jgi:hypothetical protein